MHMVNTFLVEWKSAGFQEKWNAPPFFYMKCRDQWGSLDYQEFLNAVCREEWMLVEIAWGWLCSQRKGNVDRNPWDRLGNIIPMGVYLSTSTPLGKRKTDTDRQIGKEGGRQRGVITVSVFLFSMVCGSLAIPFQWNTICLDLGTWTHLNCPVPFSYLLEDLGIQFPVNNNCSTLSG